MNIPRMLGLPRAPEEAARILAAGHVRSIDVGQVGDRIFYEAGSVGMHAAATRELPMVDAGDYGAIVRSVVAALRYRPSAVRIELDGDRTIAARPSRSRSRMARSWARGSRSRPRPCSTTAFSTCASSCTTRSGTAPLLWSIVRGRRPQSGVRSPSGRPGPHHERRPLAVRVAPWTWERPRSPSRSDRGPSCRRAGPIGVDAGWGQDGVARFRGIPGTAAPRLFPPPPFFFFFFFFLKKKKIPRPASSDPTDPTVWSSSSGLEWPGRNLSSSSPGSTIRSWSSRVSSRILPGQLGVELQLLHFLDEVVIRLRLLEGGLAVLADHHEGRQEDGLEGDRERQRRPGRRLQKNHHPQPEHEHVHVDEHHRAGERGDVVCDPELQVRGALGVEPDGQRGLAGL